MFGMRYHHDWNFEQFAIVLLRTILIYMIAGLVFPDFFGDASVDLKESFYSYRRWFFFLGFGCRRGERVHGSGPLRPTAYPDKSHIPRDFRCHTTRLRIAENRNVYNG